MGRVPGENDPLQLDFFEDGLGWFGEEEWIEEEYYPDYDEEDDDDSGSDEV